MERGHERKEIRKRERDRQRKNGKERVGRKNGKIIGKKKTGEEFAQRAFSRRLLPLA